MLFKYVNLYVDKRIFQNLCLWEIRQTVLVWEQDRTSTEEFWPGWAQSCLVVSRVQERTHFSGHHNASNLSWKPATMLWFCYAYRICTLWVFKIACFLRYRVFTNVCKNRSEVEVVMFKCNNINQSTVTVSLTEVQQSQESQLPKSIKQIGLDVYLRL